MQTIVGDSGEVDIKGVGIEPGTYYLTLGFRRYLHLYSETAWAALSEAFKVGLRPGIPVIIQQDSAELAERLFSAVEEITTGGSSLVIPGALARAVGIKNRLKITWIPAGGYWRLTPLALDDVI